MCSSVKIGLCRSNTVKMKSLGWALIQYTWCPYRREMWTKMCREGRWYEDDLVMTEAAARQGMPRIAANPMKLGRGKEGLYPYSQSNIALLTPGFATSSL